MKECKIVVATDITSQYKDAYSFCEAHRCRTDMRGCPVQRSEEIYDNVKDIIARLERLEAVVPALGRKL